MIMSKIKHLCYSLRYYLSQWKNYGLGNAVFLYQHGRKTRELYCNTIAPSQEIIDEYQKLAEKTGAKNKDYVLINPVRDELSPIAESGFLKVAADKDADIVYGDSIELWNPRNQEPAAQQYVFKPDFGIDTYRAQQYIGGVCYIKKEWIAQYAPDGIIKPRELDELILRVWEAGGTIVHVPRVFSFHTKRMEYYYKGREQVIAAHLSRCGLQAEIKQEDENVLSIQYAIREPHKKVSIIIPNKNHIDMLKKCLDSILEKTSYDNFEILIIENNSTEEETFAYYKKIEQDARIRVITCVTDWNYSYINNYGVKEAAGEYLLFLNNDTEVITPDWIEQMVMFAQRADVGAVGAKLFFSDGTIQHAGVTCGVRGVAGHAFRLWDGDAKGYMNRLVATMNLTAVTAACMMVRKEVFVQAGGFDEKLAVAFNDVDLCMCIRDAGFQIVFNPKAKLYHYESKSRGNDILSKEKSKRFGKECVYFCRKHYRSVAQGDPYYNPNLSLENDDFEIGDFYKG